VTTRDYVVQMVRDLDSDHVVMRKQLKVRMSCCEPGLLSAMRRVVCEVPHHVDVCSVEFEGANTVEISGMAVSATSSTPLPLRHGLNARVIQPQNQLESGQLELRIVRAHAETGHETSHDASLKHLHIFSPSSTPCNATNALESSLQPLKVT